jgi:hypothetical protein
MTITELLTIMQNRLLTLTEARKAAVLAGDLERVTQIDGDLLTTYTTVEKLQKAVALGITS